jgi:ammonia channel protein AmtB
VLKVDDPCGAISVHRCVWLGAVCVGIIADGSYGAGWNGVGASSYLGRADSAFWGDPLLGVGLWIDVRSVLGREQGQQYTGFG